MKRTKLEAEDTRRRLLEAGLEVFLQKGFDKASLEEIAQRLNMTRGAVYWHFKDKEAIFTELVEQKLGNKQQLLDELLLDEEVPPLQKITSFMKQLLHLLAEEEDYRQIQKLLRRCWSAMPESASQFSLRHDRYLPLFEKLCWQAQTERAVLAHVNPRYLAAYTLSFMIGASQQLLDTEEPVLERRRLADQMVYLLMRSMQ